MNFDDNKTIYIDEANELLVRLDEALLELEENPLNKSLIDEVFRHLHTIKGSGAMFEFEAIVNFTHKVESMFDRIRKNELQMTSDIAALALVAVDHISKLLNDPEITKPNTNLDRKIETYISIQESSDVRKNQGEVRVGYTKYSLTIIPKENISHRGLNLTSIFRDLESLSVSDSYVSFADYSKVPRFDDIQPDKVYVSWKIEFISKASIDDVKNIFLFVDDSAQLDIVTEPVIDECIEEVPQNRSTEVRTSSSVRVDKKKLDTLMDAVGELVILQARIKQSSKNERNMHFINLSEELGRLTTLLRDITMHVRMVPLAEMFSTFQRLVRDLAKQLSKEIRLNIQGASTELDKNIIELLKDPIVHIIRNSADHGIELPDHREAAGKDRMGTIYVKATQVGSKVHIDISDDGAGLNIKKIKARALSLGLVDKSVTDEQEIYSQIFHPGFSTVNEATDLSGRGVGMDVIKNSIEKLRGEILVDSIEGQGTSIRLTIPLTLVIVDALLLKVNNIKYVIPMSMIKEVVDPGTIEIEEAGSKDTKHNIIRLRDHTIPVVDLHSFFTGQQNPDESKAMLVIVNAEGFNLAFKVDEIVNRHQVVIKPFTKALKKIPVVSGGTILGDGTVAFILNISELIKHNSALEEAKRKANRIFQPSDESKGVDI